MKFIWRRDSRKNQQVIDVDEAARNRLLQNLDILAANGTTTVVGMLIFGLQPERHLPQSEVLFAHLQDYHFVEKLGRGIPMVVREMKKLGGREPDFQESGEEFSVTLYRK